MAVGQLTNVTASSFRSGDGCSRRCVLGQACSGEQVVAVALELRRADAGNLRQLAERLRIARRDLVQHRVVEDDIRRHSVGPRAFEAPHAQLLRVRRPGRLVGLCRRGHRHAELGEEARALARPRQPQHAFRARHAHVEQPPLLLDLGVGARLLRRQLLLLQPGDEHRVELEAFRAVQREQVDTARALAARVEAPAEIRDERRGVAIEARGEPDDAPEIRLPHELALAELVRELLQPTRLERGRAHRARRVVAGALEAPRDPARGVALEQRRALERDARFVQQLFEVGQPRVRAREDRDLLTRLAEAMDLRDDRRALLLRRGERANDRLVAIRQRRAQRLLGAAQVRHELVREREHLRRRAVVLLQSHDERLREPRGNAEQVLRARTGERVDRLIVVADDAQVVPVAEPQIEQRLLQQVDVLVLVDGERAVLGAERLARLAVLLEQLHRQPEQILEVDQPLRRLPPLVLAEDAQHQVDRDRRLAPVRLDGVPLDGDAPVLRPLDLGREVTRRAKLERRGQRVRDLAQRERLRREDLADRARREVAQLAERRGVEGGGAHGGRIERRKPLLQLTGGLVRERHRHDLRGRERTACDLLRDAARDRRRLARTGAREDAHGPTHGFRRTALLGVQAVERVHAATVPAPPAGVCDRSAKVSKLVRLTPNQVRPRASGACPPVPLRGRCASVPAPSSGASRPRRGCRHPRRAAPARRATPRATTPRSAGAPRA